MVRGDLKNMERNLSHIIHMYRPFLMVVHLIFTHYLAQDKKEHCHFAFGAVTQISFILGLHHALPILADYSKKHTKRPCP